MMLIVVALVTWSAASVVSLNFTTLNVTHTLVSGSSADMETTYYANTHEERTPSLLADVEAGVEAMLNNFHTLKFQDLSKDEKEAKIDELVSQMTTPHIKGTKNGNLFESQYLLEFKKLVKNLTTTPTRRNMEIFVMLAHHFKENPDALTRALLKGLDRVNTKIFAENLLDVQIQKWAADGIPETEVFGNLGLRKLNSNLFESPLFIKWVVYVKNRFKDPKEAEKKMLEILRPRFTRESALVRGLVVAEMDYKTKVIARGLLNAQINWWFIEGMDATAVFQRLELDKTNGNPFDSPVFPEWIGFVRFKYKVANKALISTLGDIYKDNLGEVLARGTQTQSKSVAAGLLQALEEGTIKRKRSFDLNKPLSPDKDLEDPNGQNSDMELSPLKRQKTDVSKPSLEIDLNKLQSPEST